MVDELRATAAQQGDIVLGADGQPLERGEGEGADGRGGGSALAPLQQAPGQDVGLEVLEFVPMSLNQVSAAARVTSSDRMTSVGVSRPVSRGRLVVTVCAQVKAEGRKRSRQQQQQPQAGKDGKPQRKRYVTDLGASGAQGAEDGQQQRPAKGRATAKGIFDSESDEEGGGDDASDSDGEAGPPDGEHVAKPQARGAGAGGKRPGAPQAGGRGGGKRGRGEDHLRGARRGGRGAGAGRGGAPAAAAGQRKPAFNPYDIPDDVLIKPGKRTTAMPRSGNRSMTFTK